MEHVGKTYCLGQRTGISSLQELWKARREKKDNEKFAALRDINLEVKKGERLGILGRNGAGKSTLLKLLARITEPDQGLIRIKGRVAGMLEVGTGFHRELTGRENIYLNGAMLGMNRKEIDEKLESIIEFSECREFIDTPVKKYSSGMYVKLGFSVLAHLDMDIFLMDEVLAVGDGGFQKKCLDKMREINREQGRTILYVSHNLETIREICDRCIVLDKGRLIFQGSTEKAVETYMKNILDIRPVYEFEKRQNINFATGKLQVTQIIMETPRLEKGDRYLRMKIRYEEKEDLPDLTIRLTFHDEQDRIAGTALSEEISGKNQEGFLRITADTEVLVSGIYSVDIAFMSPQGDRFLKHEYIQRAAAFQIQRQEPDSRAGWNKEIWGNIVLPAVRAEELFPGE
ncbi:MAG TPA: ATP-binding cassette domain-containing protein [Candidatus Blautia pullistercoris]|uniref:ATP-binding cassette domain-containing protein n=1 Tax=Candidatus Blautia pullistercoris TaxID=2838499 RepID=A0A9D2AMF8_9FIRM|nr:ATP-binding cassette domain-containing protein [Candidatus Blautia pullistercoris]